MGSVGREMEIPGKKWWQFKKNTVTEMKNSFDRLLGKMAEESFPVLEIVSLEPLNTEKQREKMLK